jgi:pyrroline-5-carboxylate reductase
MKKTLFIGGGNMAFAILGGLIHNDIPASSFRVIDPSAHAANNLSALKVQCSPDWPDDFEAHAVVLAVKPQMMQAVLQEQSKHLAGKLLISIAAGVSVDQIKQWSQQHESRVVRCMPNTPALVSKGISGLYLTPNCTPDDWSLAYTLFQSCGEVLELQQEEQINAVTAISGSGPGYVFYLMEALAKAAQDMGFSENQANLLVNQTFLGAATLAKQSDDSFSTLREKVTSKGGTTFAGLETLRQLKVEESIVSAAKAALHRAIELQNQSG